MKHLRLVPLLTIVLLSPSFAQSSDITKEPGYVDFGDLDQFGKSTDITEVRLDENLLSALADLSPDDDPNLMHILHGLKFVNANVYAVKSDTRQEVESKMKSIDAKLSGQGWKRIVRSRKQDETANVYIRQNNTRQIIGLVVTSLDADDEAAFVNIVGTIDLKTIGKLGRKLNIRPLEGVNDHDE